MCVSKTERKRSEPAYEEELVTLTHGQYFGEWGIIENKMRKASAVAMEDCDMFILDKRYFSQTIGVSIFLFRNV
jgi:CRP-like cAMP-binding protein